jgi:hypothetical protein
MRRRFMAASPRSRNKVSRTFANLKVNTKILAILLIASLVALVVGVLGVVKLGEVAGTAEKLASEGVGAIETLSVCRPASSSCGSRTSTTSWWVPPEMARRRRR